VPSLISFISYIREYQQDLLEKRRTLAIEANNLVSEYNKQAEEMNERCRQIAENANDFAGSALNRDANSFKRFLSHAHRASDIYSDEATVQQLRQFIINWFQTFSTTVIRPESNPVWANIQNDMQRCTTVESLCDAARSRVDQISIGFKFQETDQMSFIDDRDTDEIGEQDLEANERKCGVTWIKLHGCVRAKRLYHERPVTYAVMCAEMRQGRPGLDEQQLRSEWRSLRQVQGIGCQRASTPNGMPFEVMFGCGKLRVLSWTHVNFLILVFVDIALLMYEALAQRWFSVGLVLINEICVISVLACFEQIDEIARLEKDIEQKREQVHEVADKREKANKDWDQVHRLHELWKYRTLPTLSVMHKVTEYLEDKGSQGKWEPQDHFKGAADFLQHANQSLDCLNIKLGSLESWRERTEPLAEEWKETIGRQLRACESEGNVIGLLDKLPIITTDLRQLDAVHPSHSRAPRSSDSDLPGRERASTAPSGRERSGSAQSSQSRQSRVSRAASDYRTDPRSPR
jgi:hypothetical protein